MRISQNGLELIKEFEGFSATPYVCAGGKVTVGFGHTNTASMKMKPITKRDGEALLKQDLREAEATVERLVKVDLTQNQFDALISFVFNVGAGALAKSTLLKLLNKGNYEAVPAQLMRWNKANGKPLAGLTRRRQAEGVLWSDDDNANLGEMSQAVDAPDKSLVKSRTIANAGTAGIVGTAMIAAPAIEPAGEVVRIAQENPHGLLLVIGIALLVFAAIAIYLRIDDKRKG